MVRQHRHELVKANIIAILGALMSVPIPLLIPLMVDEVLLHKPAAAVALMNQLFPQSWHGPILYILAILVLTLLLRLIALVLGVWQMRQFTCISKDVIFRIRRRLLQRLERVSMAEYETLGSGVVASHMVTDLDTVDRFVGETLSKLLVAILSLTGTAIVLLWMHWPLALFILFLNPIVIYITTVFGRRVKELKRKENSAYQIFQESLAETLDAIQEIRAANRERHYIGRIIDKADNVRRHSSAFTWKSDAASRLSFVVFVFGFDIFRALSMFTVLYSDLSIGQMMAIYAYLWYMSQPVQEIVGIQYTYHAARAALQRINSLFKMQLEPDFPHEKNPFTDNDNESVSIQIRHLNFSYSPDKQILRDLSLDIAVGEKIALVGASGGGKTTFVQVLLGLYPADSGQIRFNQIPIEQIGMDVVRDHVSIVLQHPALFNDSLRNNLTLGNNIADEQLWQALHTAQLSEAVKQLPQQLDTIIGRNGMRLSGGQKQRVAIARMLLSNPQVVILDEATSALDSDTEGRLHEALQAFLHNRTTLIIAHRLSAVRQADRALVFEDGRIIQQGHHDELIQGDGLYAHLYRNQHEQAS
ncbi:MAG: ABC transporter ATP-binding protein/permease [gamma proteobacterium symbiont of Bathyaustriella thionipta]|nr:ABC transporter ATP-binding protein/permease [gamma proteobacterium symbiont of Bathyaustriella thionipta]